VLREPPSSHRGDEKGGSAFGNAAPLPEVPAGLHFDSCCSANAHSRSGSRSPTFANSIISLATDIVAGSLRSTNPSLPNAASKAADIGAMSSGPNASSRSRNGRIGTARLLETSEMEAGRFASQPDNLTIRSSLQS
jgi:hypothetical protein